MPKYSFTLNGKKVNVDAPADLSTLWALRDKLGVTGVKYGCGINVCQACTSHLDGEAFNPCVTHVSDVAGREITTIEGLADGDVLHPVQEAWLEQDVAQCGFCQPGQIMAVAALLAKNTNPSDEDIDAIDNTCRCGTYFRIREAVKSAAAKIRANGIPNAPGSGDGDDPAVVPGSLPATGLGGTAAVGAGLVAGAAVLRHVLNEGDDTVAT